MNNAQDRNRVVIDPVIDTTFTVDDSSQAWTDPVAGNSGEAGLGDPFQLTAEFVYELDCSFLALTGEINEDFGQIFSRLWCKN